jgi:hypothetical protein
VTAVDMPGLDPEVDVPTGTAHPAPPDAIVLAVRGEVDLSTSTLSPDLTQPPLRAGRPDG